MFIERAFVLGLALAALPPVAANAAADAERLLAESMLPPLEAYRGTLEVSAGDSSRSKIVEVSEDPERGVRREIVDRLGLPLVTIVSDGETEWVYDRLRAVAWKGEPADPDLKLLDPDVELDLLMTNYEVRSAGSSRVAGRVCRALEIWTHPEPGSESRRQRRLCVDAGSGIVLERVTYDALGREASAVRFLRVEIGVALPARTFEFRPPAGVSVRANRLRPDYMELEEAATATDLSPRPPAWVPTGFVFESVNLLAYRGTTVLHYRYSDGVDALSVFQAPRGTRLKFPGEAPRAMTLEDAEGRLALWSGGKTLTWSAGDRFVVVGRLSIESLRRIADSVPSEGVAMPDPESGFVAIDGSGEERSP
jgi:outer membrane lipoprotein-sorting protein